MALVGIFFRLHLQTAKQPQRPIISGVRKFEISLAGIDFRPRWLEGIGTLNVDPFFK
jgi:hypothetical protein